MMLSFEEAYASLLNLPTYNKYGASALKPGFDRIGCLLEGMGNPHHSLRVVHVGGTNGKGSTCYMITAILRAAGSNVGLHTSPHILKVTERMRVNGNSVTDEVFSKLVANFQPLFEECKPSFFEATLALSLYHFAQRNVDYAVVEVGLGGRLDATNILATSLTVITDIQLDHTNILGDTIEEIAAEKAGIIKPNVPLVVGHNHPDALTVLKETAQRIGAPVIDARSWSMHQQDGSDEVVVESGNHSYRFTPHLSGDHQLRNAVLAIAATTQLLGSSLSDDAVVAGLEDTRNMAGVRGRLEIITRNPMIVVDVGHNPDGVGAALTSVEKMLGTDGRLFVAVGLKKTKDAVEIFTLLRDHANQVYPVAINSPRSASLDYLTKLARLSGLPFHACDHPQQARKHFEEIARPNDVLLFVGSHQVAEQILGTEKGHIG